MKTTHTKRLNGFRKTAKRKARQLADQVALPYVQTMVNELAGLRRPLREGAVSVDSTLTNGTPDTFHNMLHELRTVELERSPKGARRVLSVGANGRWYFDWFERAVGVVEEHLGIEAFEEMPTDLPAYVTWIPDTADHMKTVEDGSVDLVFAGQTTEHLWSYELAGFLEEAHRVLRPEGTLILDSPNRLVTEHLWWSHGGHTLELSLREITELLELAGFSVQSTAGIWRCRINGEVLPLLDGLGDAAVLARRASTARDDPDASFVWWLTARRTENPRPSEELRARAKALFLAQWNTRVCRGLFLNPGDVALPISTGHRGEVGRTLPFPLKPGKFSVSATLSVGSWADVEGFTIEFIAPGGQVLHRLPSSDAERAADTLTWQCEQPFLIFATVLVVAVEDVRRSVMLCLPLDLRCDI